MVRSLLNRLISQPKSIEKETQLTAHTVPEFRLAYIFKVFAQTTKLTSGVSTEYGFCGRDVN